MSDICTVIILAGGQGVRMGRAGRFSSKAALIAYNAPLLIRQFDHLLEAGFGRIIVSTNRQHLPQLRGLLDSYHPGVNIAGIDIIDNPAHAVGPIEALAAVVQRVETPRFLLVLGDQFNRANQYLAFVPLLHDPDAHICARAVDDPREIRLGGHMEVENGHVLSVDRPNSDPALVQRCSGTTLFTTAHARAALDDFLAEAPPGLSVGDFQDAYARLGGMRPLYGPDFINVNSPDQLLLATLYAAEEAHADHAEARAMFTRMAVQMRRKLVNGVSAESRR